jgi:hypothetical protein
LCCDVSNIDLFLSDTIQTLPTWLDDDNSSEQLLEDTSLSETPLLPDDNKVPGIASMGKKPHPTSTPNSRGKLASMRRRVQSPDCLRNPFLEDNADILQKLNSQCGRVLYSVLVIESLVPIYDGVNKFTLHILVHSIPKWCSGVFSQYNHLGD